MKAGVLALQGDFKEHCNILKNLSEVCEVRQKKDFQGLDALVIPGGESTTIAKLMKKYDLEQEIIKMHKENKLIYGTCAGAIVVAKKVIGNQVNGLNLIDIEIERNAYGRQIDSFEDFIDIKGIGKYKAVFIRAPIIKNVGDDVDVLSTYNGTPVMVREKNVLVTTFHPELTKDRRIHEYFLRML